MRAFHAIAGVLAVTVDADGPNASVQRRRVAPSAATDCWAAAPRPSDSVLLPERVLGRLNLEVDEPLQLTPITL